MVTHLARRGPNVEIGRMKRIPSWIIWTIVLIVLYVTGGFGSISQLAQTALLKTGVLNASTQPQDEDPSKFSYDFQLRDAQGKIISADEFKGKTLFVNLWATWCGPCRAEMPSINQLYERVDKSKVAFIMLSLDRQGEEQAVFEFVRKKAFAFPVYTPASALPSILQVNSIPTTFVVSSTGKVVSREVGATNFSSKKFQDFLENL